MVCPGLEPNKGLRVEAAGERGQKRDTNEVHLSTNIANHLVISELYYNPEDESNSEFIELYNPTGNSVDISDWSFSDDGGSSWIVFGEDTDTQNNMVVPSKGFLLLVDGGWSSNRDDSSWPDGDVIDEISLSNSGGTVKIKNSAGSEVDSVSYPGDYENGQSVERKAISTSTAETMRGSDADKGNGYDTDNFANDFVGPLPALPQNTSSNTESYESSANQLPIADPGGPYQCEKGETIQLDGSNSKDPDGNIVSYKWEFSGDGNYDDDSGSTASFTCNSPGTRTVALEVKDNDGATSNESTEVSVIGELEVTMSDQSVPARQTSEVTITASYPVEGTPISFSTERGNLSNSTAKIGTDGKAQVTLTAPNSTGVSIVRVSAESQVVAKTVVFEKPDGPEAVNLKTVVFPEGQNKITIDSKENIGLLAEATRADGSLQERVALSLVEYSSNPTGEGTIDAGSGGFIKVHSDQPSALKEIILEVYLNPWPDNEPIIKYWDSTDSNWINCDSYIPNKDSGFLEVTINSSTQPAVSNLSRLLLVSGSVTSSETGKTKEIRITEPGWHMVAMPLNPTNSSPRSVFGEIDPSKINHWDPGKNNGKGGYKTPDDGYKLQDHKGNWVHLKESQIPRSLTITGKQVSRGPIRLVEPGWHQIGVPKSYSPSDLGIKQGGDGKVIPVSQAIEEAELISRFIWEWKTEKGSYYAYEIGANQKSFATTVAYWVFTKQPNVHLVFPFNSPPSPPDNTEMGRDGGTSLTSIDAMSENIPTPPPPPEIEDGDGFQVMAVPNPVIGGGRVKFKTEGSGISTVKVKVYTPAGKLIYNSGTERGNSCTWQMTDSSGRKISSGLYVYSIIAHKSEYNTIRKAGKLLILN